MKRMSAHKGSALLIVIGMLAFMVVSAVAFSAYMRYSRQPSSYLRRSAATRQLVKAALARAIDDIDIAVCDNPHPGVGSRGVMVQKNVDETLNSEQRNTWPNRVLMFTNDWSNLTYEDNLDILEETVPVLTLEGLAYIPPPLVNAARYYGRRTPTARWQTFDFDSGRYAYVAIDVSDYFDVNRLSAGYGRNSTPERRITITHAFPDDSNAVSWDSLMQKYRDENDDFTYDYKTRMPLISVADMNLAMGSQNAGGLKFPFYDYVKNNKTRLVDSGDADMFRSMTFVTDSWFPRESQNNSNRADYDITISRDQGGVKSGQPFSQFKNNAAYNDFSGGGITTDAGNFLRNSLSTLGLIALYDYLDPDSVPVSLACPSVERVPMCCGLKTSLEGNLKLKAPEEVGGVKLGQDDGAADAKEIEDGPSSREVFQHVVYKLDGAPLNKCSVEALFMYPFLHDTKNPSFNIDGHASLFFTSAAPGSQAKFRWKSGTSVPQLGNGTDEVLMGMNLSGQSISFSNVTEPNKAFTSKKMNGSGSSGGSGGGIDDPFVEIWYSWTQTKDPDTGRYSPMERPSGASPKQVKRCLLIAADGSKDIGGWEAPSVLETKIKLSAAVRVRTKYNDPIRGNKTVDLVPACSTDDSTENGISHGSRGADAFGGRWPVMRFDAGEFTFNDALKGQIALQSETTAMVKDPRFNYAPESWCKTDNSLDASGWLSYAQNKIGSERDIFMATSDQGYLQSIYELAFLPQFRSNFSGGDSELGCLDKVDNLNYEDFAADGSEYAVDLMWRTYCPYGNNHDDFDSLRFTSSGTGFKVNPYSDSTNVMMAVFANTPMDWRCASTNNTDRLEELAVDQFNLKYAWNENNSAARMNYEDLEDLAGSFIEEVCNSRNSMSSSYVRWDEVWMDFGWEDSTSGELCGIPLSGSKVWSVDRKFFFGFWKDCFAVKQQLFLVFVRAEPSMMGGKGQLGARAVALVWRDPDTRIGYPHRTRVLFYRQLD